MQRLPAEVSSYLRGEFARGVRRLFESAVLLWLFLQSEGFLSNSARAVIHTENRTVAAILDVTDIVTAVGIVVVFVVHMASFIAAFTLHSLGRDN